MKTYKYIFLMLAAASIASACNDELNPNEINKANPGDEVQFGATLPGGTKTIYGKETSLGFPIYWKNNDLVKVASPQCLSGRNNAEYKVEAGDNQNYATSLTKTGAAGLQWGEVATADFYSIYPSNDNTSLSVSADSEGKTTKAIATLRVSAAQTARLSSNVTDKAGNPVLQPDDMSDVVMYAKTTGVTSGRIVELHYVPFSTVIEFEINGPESGEDNMTVQSITLSAPEGTNIAGTFELDLYKASASAAGNTNLSAKNISNGSNTILLHLLDENNAYITIGANKKVKAKLCILPQPYTSLEGWTVTVACNAGQYSKTIGQYTVTEGKTKNLVAGQVHKVQLPSLSYKKGWTYDEKNWIPSLPDYENIYLSELSLPGAWYAGSDEKYQATNDITTLWNKGVRAFAVECRTNSTFTSRHWTPNYVCISGSGRNTSLGPKAYTSGTNITSVIESIKTSLESHPNEYAVLVLSYADGGEGGHRDEDHAFFLNGIATALSGYSDIIYSSAINANTTVNDVKGKLIVKVNVDNNIPLGNYTVMNALISCNPFLSQMSGADYSRPYYSDLYWSNWADTYKTYDLVSNLQGASGNEKKFVWVFSSANRTQTNTGTNTTIPTYKQRQTALEAMGDYSKSIYDASTHNVWFYYNCGGTQATSQTSSNPSPTAFAKVMNKWLLNRLKIKVGEVANSNGEIKAEPSPLGIVMFNQCTGNNNTYYGADIIKYIIEMNSMFYLKHAGTSGGSTGGSTGGSEDNTAQNDSSFEDGGEMF